MELIPTGTLYCVGDGISKAEMSLLLLLLPATSGFLLPLTPRLAVRRAAVCACDAAAPEEATGGIISFSERALAQLESMREKQDDGKLILRMGVRAGGCSGMSYVMDLEKPDKVDEGDTVVDLAEGMQCAIDPKSLMFLYGMQLDYSDELIGGGFSFQNPNAEETVSSPLAPHARFVARRLTLASLCRLRAHLPAVCVLCVCVCVCVCVCARARACVCVCVRLQPSVRLRQELRHLSTVRLGMTRGGDARGCECGGR